MNPYDIDTELLEISKEITDAKDLLKLRLAGSIIKVVTKMSTEDVLFLTKLHKSDLSRIKSLNLKRFSIDRLIGILDLLGYSTTVDVKRKKAS